MRNEKQLIEFHRELIFHIRSLIKENGKDWQEENVGEEFLFTLEINSETTISLDVCWQYIEVFYWDKFYSKNSYEKNYVEEVIEFIDQLFNTISNHSNPTLTES